MSSEDINNVDNNIEQEDEDSKFEQEEQSNSTPQFEDEKNSPSDNTNNKEYHTNIMSNSNDNHDSDLESNDTIEERDELNVLKSISKQSGPQQPQITNAPIFNSSSIQRRKSSLAKESQIIMNTLHTMMDENTEESLAAALSEFEEVQLLMNDKEYFNNLFDKIDPSGNDDVDEDEWYKGIKKLNIPFNVMDVKTLFEAMDHEKNGYITREDWTSFLTSTWETPELQRLQSVILTNLKGHNRKPSSRASGLNVGMNLNNLNTHQVKQYSRELTDAAKELANNLNTSLQEEQKFYEEIEKIASTNPEFSKPELCHKWIAQEVAWWLDSIELGQYAKIFVDEAIDGSILLNDVGERLLIEDIGIKPLHIGKILREIDKLRALNKESLNQPYRDWQELGKENDILLKELEDANKKILELEENNNKLKFKALLINNKGNMLGVSEERDEDLIDNNTNNNNNNNNTTTGGYEEKFDDMMSIIIIEKDEEIKKLKEDINRIIKQKVDLAINTGEEIQKLRKIIAILSNEYTTLMTPQALLGGYHPIESLLGYLGYEKK